VAAIVMQRVEQTDQVAARRPQARAGRKVGDGSDFEGILNSVRLQSLARQLVAQIVDVINRFGLRIVQPDLTADDRAVDHHVHELVQAHGEDESAVLAVVRGKIRPPAAQGHAEGSAGDDHSRNPAAAASVWNIFTVSSDRSSSDLPTLASFFRMSLVTVMMWHPQASA